MMCFSDFKEVIIMAATKAEKKDTKELCELILKTQGLSYEDWLHEKHNDVVTQNSNVLKKAVNNLLVNKSSLSQ